MRKFILCIVMVCVILGGVSARAETPLTGTWASSFGELQITEHISGGRILFHGTYNDGNGIISGYTDGEIARGIFAQLDPETGAVAEDGERLGTMEWRLTPDGQFFSGVWRWGRIPVDRRAQGVLEWNGRRISSEFDTQIRRERPKAAGLVLFSGKEIIDWLNEVPLNKAPPLSFDWTMADRYGIDRNSNDIYDLPNTLDYVSNYGDGPAEDLSPCPLEDMEDCIEDYAPRFAVDLTTDKTILPSRLRWTIRSPGQLAPRIIEGQAAPRVFLTEGRHRISLELIGFPSSRSLRTVDVQDHYIAVLGDSFASGEGAPETKQNIYPVPADGSGPPWPTRWWADPGYEWPRYGVNNRLDWTKITTEKTASGMFKYRTALEHLRSHRSSFTHASQLALDLERRDDKSSVTFVNVAQSGATIDIGVLGRYHGVGNEPNIPSPGCFTQTGGMCSQMSYLRNLTRTRSIDKLYMSIGGNDAGFANVIASLVVAWRDDVLGFWEHKARDANPFAPPLFHDEVQTEKGESAFGDTTVQKIKKAVNDGKWPDYIEAGGYIPLVPWPGRVLPANALEGQAIPHPRYLVGLDGLGQEYDRLDTEIDRLLSEKRLLGQPTLILSPFFVARMTDPGYDNRDVVKHRTKGYWYCLDPFDSGEATDTFTELHPVELAWAEHNVYKELVDIMKSAAQRSGWRYIVQGDTVLRHGFCADKPAKSYDEEYSHPVDINLNGNRRWYNSSSDGMRQQVGSASSSKGVMHPNPRGFAFVKYLMVKALENGEARTIHGLRDVFNVDENDTLTEAQRLPRSSAPITREISFSNDWDVEVFEVAVRTSESLRVSYDPAQISGSSSSGGGWDLSEPLFDIPGGTCVAITVFDQHGNVVETNSARLNSDAVDEPFTPGDETTPVCDSRSQLDNSTQAARWSMMRREKSETYVEASCSREAAMRQLYVAVSRPNNVFFDPVTGRGDVESDAVYGLTRGALTITRREQCAN